MSTEIYSPGLEGVIAGETAVSSVAEGLRYRGYAVTELAKKATFEEVAYLLLYGELPDTSQLAGFKTRIAQSMTLPALVREVLQKVPAGASPMDVVRSAVSLLAHFDPQTQESDEAANLAKAERLLGQIPVVIAEYDRARRGLPNVSPRPELGHAGNLLYMLKGTPASADDTRAFDVSLILYAEHEFNASTFTARVVTSTEADLHSSIVAAIGALKGRLHGGANEKVMDLLLQTGGPEHAKTWIEAALGRREKIMGFGHRIYKAGDVRAGVLKDYARQAAKRIGDERWERTAEIIEEVVAKEKNLYPNLDWPAGRLYHSLGLDVPLYTPFFVAARVAGWSAHVIEQTAKNRIMRPRGRYIGAAERSMA